MSSCGHSFESLRKRCSKCDTQQKKITGKCCSKCGQPENCEIVCPECTNAVLLTKCQHSYSQWKKICKSCEEEWDSLDSTFCSECTVQGNFIYFCELCPKEAIFPDYGSFSTQPQGQSDNFSSVQSVPANSEVTNYRTQARALESGESYLADMRGSIAKHTMPEGANQTVDPAAKELEDCDMHLNLVGQKDSSKREPIVSKQAESINSTKVEPENFQQMEKGTKDSRTAYEQMMKHTVPETSNRYSFEGETTKQQNRDPQSTEQQNRDPQSTEQQSSDPQSKEQQSRDQKSTEQQKRDPQSTEQQSSDPQSKEQQSRDQKSTEQQKRDQKSTEQQKRDPQSTEQQKRESQSTEQQSSDPHSKEQPKRYLQSTEQQSRDLQSTEQRNRKLLSIDQQNRDSQSTEQRNRKLVSIDQQNRDSQSTEQRNRKLLSIDQQNRDSQSTEQQSSNPHVMGQRSEKQQKKNICNWEETKEMQSFEVVTKEEAVGRTSTRTKTTDFELKSSTDGRLQPLKAGAKIQLQNEIQKRFPQEEILPMKVRFHILNDSFEFNPENDEVIIVFGNKELGGGNAAESPFYIDAKCMTFSQWRDSEDRMHKLTEICYKFFLPKRALSGKIRFEYEYSIKANRTNGFSFSEEVHIHEYKRDITNCEIQFDCIISGPKLNPVFGKYNNLSHEYYRMVYEQLNQCAARELAVGTYPPCTTIRAVEWAVHRYYDYKMIQAEDIRNTAIRSLVDHVMTAPSKHGFSTSAQKSAEDWNISLELLRLCVESGECFSANKRILGLKQDSAVQLLHCLLPPVNYAPEKMQKFTGRRDQALENLFNYVMTTDSFFFELLFAIPAYHLLVLKVDPADSDLSCYEFKESLFPQWCGFNESQQVGFFKKNRYDYGRVDQFLAEYSKVDPLLCRFFTATAHFDYINDFFKLRKVPALVKLATLQSLTSDSKKLKAVSEAAPSVISSLQESLSELTDFELKQCLLITRSIRDRVCSIDNVELYLQLVDCMLSCKLEKMRRGHKKKKKDNKEI
ncbi:hypothetical protein BOX15_Mlig026657g1, partial [Macrostomum lignano]